MKQYNEYLQLEKCILADIGLLPVTGETEDNWDVQTAKLSEFWILYILCGCCFHSFIVKSKNMN